MCIRDSYWVTNFNADQRGGHSWTYYLTTSADNSNGFASRFGWGCRIPFLTRVIPGGGNGENNWQGSIINGWPSEVVLVSAIPSPDGKSVQIHLRETAGRNTNLELTPVSYTHLDVYKRQHTFSNRNSGRAPEVY